jgi:hypothetical protein
MLPLDNLIYKDYAAWKLENQEMLEKFKDNNNVIYDRLEPVYAVLNHIYDLVVEGIQVDEDYDLIFYSGFDYLGTQFEIIKIYYNTLFQENCDDFIEYSDLLLYLIYISDVKNDLESNDIESDIPSLNDLEVTLENMIMERNNDKVYATNLFNTVFEEVFQSLNYEYVSIVDVFSEIAEALGIYLYEDNDYVIGKDIK